MEFRADLHIHSQESFDSSSKPIDILKAAKLKGLNVIAVTDHHTIRGGLLTREMAQINPQFGISVIVGAEITTEAGDIVGLFLDEEIRSKSSLEVIQIIREQGGISVFVHPFRKGQPDDEVIQAVDAVEIYNARSTNRENLLNQNLVLRSRKPGLAGSDAHYTGDIGSVFNRLIHLDDQVNSFGRDFLGYQITPVINR